MIRTAKRASRFSVAVVALAVPVVLLAPASSWARPAVTVRDAAIPPGGTTIVTGSGWPSQALVQVQVCGNLGLDGSADCGLPDARNIGTAQDGTFSTAFTVTLPPSPCPCVVRVNTLTFSDDARTPITIVGAPTSEPKTKTASAEITRYVQITAVQLEGSASWTRWFGAGYWRTLKFTVRNVGDAVVATAQLSVTYGTSEHPTGVVDTPKLPALAPGESTTVRVPVRVDALSIGAHHVRVEVSGFGRPATATIGTSTYPWALLIVAIAVAQLVLVGGRNWLRRRLHEHEDEAAAVEPDDTEDQPDEHHVIEVEPDAIPSHVAAEVPADLAPDGARGRTIAVSQGAEIAAATTPLLPAVVDVREEVVAMTDPSAQAAQTEAEPPARGDSLTSLRDGLTALLATVDELIAQRAAWATLSTSVEQARAEADALRRDAQDELSRARVEAREIVEQARRSVLHALDAINDPTGGAYGGSRDTTSAPGLTEHRD